MATNRAVREGSIYRTGVVLRTKINLYFSRMWYGISHFQSYYSIPNPIPPLFHYIISIRKAWKLYPSSRTQNNSEWMLFCRNRQSPSSKCLLKTQKVQSFETLHPDNVVQPTHHYAYSPMWKLEAKNLVESSWRKNWITSTTFYSSPT